MTKFYKVGGQYRLIAEDAIDLKDRLPVATYSVGYGADNDQYFLTPVTSFTLGKVYGDAPRMAKRYLDTFEQRDNMTNVLLSGEKGSGKSTLAKLVSIEAAKRDIATVLVNEPYSGGKFNKFVQLINQPAVFVFDEFEKVYNTSYGPNGEETDRQEQLLTLLDGTYPTKKMFIFTCNDEWMINKHMRNRPGRIYYKKKYIGVTKEFVVEYCNENLREKKKIDDIVKLVELFPSFNFDMLKATVEEVNRYGEDVVDVIDVLNIELDGSHEDYESEVYVNGKLIEHAGIVHRHNFNPMNGIEVYMPKKGVGGIDFGDG